MSEETDRLRAELAALRAELKKEAVFDSIHWDKLLAAAPAPKPVPVPPEPVAPAEDDHRKAAHHNRALPALVEDDDGITRLFMGGHGPGDHGRPTDEHDHDHDNHTHPPSGRSRRRR